MKEVEAMKANLVAAEEKRQEAEDAAVEARSRMADAEKLREREREINEAELRMETLTLTLTLTLIGGRVEDGEG